MHSTYSKIARKWCEKALRVNQVLFQYELQVDPWSVTPPFGLGPTPVHLGNPGSRVVWLKILT